MNLKERNLNLGNQEINFFKSTNFNDDIDRALQKDDKDWTYFANDIGYHANKFNRNFDILDKYTWS